MLDLTLIFLAQFGLIFGLGLQQLNIQGGHKVLAATTSLFLGISGFYITATIAEAGKAGLLSAEGLVYLSAGPIAIVCAMKAHPWIKKKVNRE